MEKVVVGLKILVLSLISLCLVGVATATWANRHRLEAILQNLETTSRQGAEVSASAQRVLALYEAELSSNRNRKALSASLAAAASWQATARLVNTQLIPEATETIVSLRDTNKELQTLVKTQNRELALTQDQVRDTLGSLEGQIELVGPEIHRLTAQSTVAVEQTATAVAEFQRSGEKMTQILANLETASASAPGIATSLERIAASGQRWQRPISLATLVIALLGAIR